MSGKWRYGRAPLAATLAALLFVPVRPRRRRLPARRSPTSKPVLRRELHRRRTGPLSPERARREAGRDCRRRRAQRGDLRERAKNPPVPPSSRKRKRPRGSGLLAREIEELADAPVNISRSCRAEGPRAAGGLRSSGASRHPRARPQGPHHRGRCGEFDQPRLCASSRQARRLRCRGDPVGRDAGSQRRRRVRDQGHRRFRVRAALAAKAGARRRGGGDRERPRRRSAGDHSVRKPRPGDAA